MGGILVWRLARKSFNKSAADPDDANTGYIALKQRVGRLRGAVRDKITSSG